MPDDAPALLQQRRTKIIATLPAADATAATVDELAACGVDAVLLVGDPSLAECTTPTEQASDRVVSKASKKIPLPVLVDLGDCDLNATAESFGPKECFAILPLTTGDAIRAFGKRLNARQNISLVGRVDSGAPPEAAEPILAAVDAVLIDAVGDAPCANREAVVEACRRSHTPVFMSIGMNEIGRTVSSGVDAVVLTVPSDAIPAAIAAADQAIREEEGRQFADSAFQSLTDLDGACRPLPLGDAIGRAAASLSRDLRVRTICAISPSGLSALMLSASRPAAPVIAATSNPRVARFLRMCWGVTPILVRQNDLETPVPLLRRAVTDLELADTGDFALIVAGYRRGDSDARPAITTVRI